MSGKELAEKYNDFIYPAVSVWADHQEITADGFFLESVEVVATVGEESDMAVLLYRVERFPKENLSALERYIHLGQKMEVMAGYEDKTVMIFLGYLHEVNVVDSMQEYVEYSLICLDVKGWMKKNSVFLASGTKKAQEVLKDIVNSTAYRTLIKEKKISGLPEDFNQDCVIRGATHYEWICNLARYLDYEFFCDRGVFTFRKAGDEDTEFTELTTEYGLLGIRTLVTLSGQTGSVSVYGYDRKDEKIVGTAKWQSIQGPFADKIQKTIKDFSLSFWEMGLETKKQADLRAQAVIRREAAKASRMEAVTVGVPEFRPGICVKIAHEDIDSLSGTIYVEEVSHLLDGQGYITVLRGRRKG